MSHPSPNFLMPFFLIPLVLSACASPLSTSNNAAPKRSDPLSNPASPQNTTSKTQEIEVREGTQLVTVDNKTLLKLPSGATVDLQYFTFNPSGHSTDDSETNQFEHSANFKAYHKGYLYAFSRYSCMTGEVWHDDYSSNDRISCSFTISAERTASPDIASYDAISFVASSQSRQIYDHSLKSIQANPGKAYYDLEVPYMQFWGTGDGTFWGAGGNTLRVTTVYGIGTVNFDEQSFDSDLRNQSVKSVQVGPLTTHIKMTAVSCYPPYRQSDGQCYPQVMTSGPYQGQTVYIYNRVDYAINFTQSKKPDADQLILHY